MSIKNIFSLTTSIISLFIFILFSNLSSNSDENNIKYYSNDEGILSIMYHRFNESKYPSTNIQMDIFKQQIEIIEDSNYKFNNPSEFEKMFNTPKIKKAPPIGVISPIIGNSVNANKYRLPEKNIMPNKKE